LMIVFAMRDYKVLKLNLLGLLIMVSLFLQNLCLLGLLRSKERNSL
jgi:hypothetical protein